jgi:hypothetical protein
MFFVAFWVLTVLIMLNLVISFILEIYSEAEEMILKLRKNFEQLKKGTSIEIVLNADTNEAR